MPLFTAAIFDLDGTLFDSMGVWEKIDQNFLRLRGLDVPQDYAETIRAMPFCEIAAYTIKRFCLPETPEALMREWRVMAQIEYNNHVRLKKHAKEYLKKLKAHDIRIATATTLSPSLSRPALQRNGIYPFFEAHCTTDEVERGKEHPDIYLLAAERLHVDPGDCIVFEDILQGIRGAKSAGMRAYGVFDRSADQDREKIIAEADGYIEHFGQAPLPISA